MPIVATGSTIAARIFKWNCVYSLAAAAFWTSAAANEQDRGWTAECSEIAHRIACHSVQGACGKNEPSEIFERRDQLELMIVKLCSNGSKGFSKYYWVDVHGAYRPYYLDKDGNSVKFPPDRK